MISDGTSVMRDDTSIVSDINSIASDITNVVSDAEIVIRYDDEFVLVLELLDLFGYMASLILQDIIGSIEITHILSLFAYFSHIFWIFLP